MIQWEMKKMNFQILANKTVKNVTKEHGSTCKKSLKEEIIEEITEILMEKTQDMFNQKVPDAPRNNKTPHKKNLEKTQN
jgi:hypothetical protein